MTWFVILVCGDITAGEGEANVGRSLRRFIANESGVYETVKTT